MLTNPSDPIFYYGGDHLGVSLSANTLGPMLRCRSNGILSDVNVTYHGCDYGCGGAGNPRERGANQKKHNLTINPELEGQRVQRGSSTTTS